MSWTTIAIISVGLLVAALRVAGAEDADTDAGDAPRSRCDGGRPECPTVAPRVGAPPPLAGLGGGTTDNLPSTSSGANAGSKGSDRHDIRNASASSLIRPEATGSAVQGTFVPENTNQPQVEKKYDQKEAIASENVKKQEVVLDSVKDKGGINWKSEETAHSNDNSEKHGPIPTLQTPEGNIVTKDVIIPPENKENKHLSVSRHLESRKFDTAPDLDSHSTDIASGALNNVVHTTESAYISISPHSLDSGSLDLKVENKDSDSSKITTEAPIKAIYSPTQKTSIQKDTFLLASKANEESLKQLASFEHQKQEDVHYYVTDQAASPKTQSPGIKGVAEDSTKHSVSLASQVQALPSDLIRSQVAEPVHPELRDTFLAQSAESRQSVHVQSEFPPTNQKSAINDSFLEAKASHRLHSVNVIRKEPIESAQGFIPASNEVKSISLGHSQDMIVASDATFSPTAVTQVVASSSKAGRLVDQVHQELEDPTPGTAQVTIRSNVIVNNQNPAAVVIGVEPAPRTLLQSQVVDPVHQELEETTPVTLVKTATSNPTATGISASKVAFELTNHVSVMSNETGGGLPADNIRKDLLVENGSRMSYATAFDHSVHDDDEPLTTTAAGGRKAGLEPMLQNSVTHQEQHGPPDDVRLGLLHVRTNNNSNGDNKLKELQQQLHALKSDGISTQPPINTVKPTLEKDFAALKDLRVGIIQLQTTAESLASNKYPGMPSIETSNNQTNGQQHLEMTTSDMPRWMLNDTTVEPRFSEEAAGTSILTGNSDTKHIRVPTSAVPTTTLKDKTLGKDEDFKIKTKTTGDVTNRNKKLTTGLTTNHSDLWTRIFPVNSTKPQTYNSSEKIDNFSEEREELEPAAAEKLPEFSRNDSQILPTDIQRPSNSSGTEIYEEMEMIPVPISTVVPSTVINHRHERVDNMSAETVVQSEAVQEVNNVSVTTTTSPQATGSLQVNDRRCKSAENCSQDIHEELDLSLLSITLTTTESFTPAITSASSITEISAEDGSTTENIEMNLTTLSSVVGKTNATETSSLIPTDAVPTSTIYSTVPFTSDQFTTVATIKNQPDSADVYSSTEEPQDVHTGTEFYGTTTIPLGNVKGEENAFSTVSQEAEQATQTVQTLPPPELDSTTKVEGSQWFYGDQPQDSSNNNAWQEETTTVNKNNRPSTRATNIPDTTTNQVPDKDLSEWDIPDKSETVTAFCRLTLLASGEQVCLYLGGLPTNIAELLQHYTGRVIVYQQVVIHMPGSEVRCDDITRERTLDVYIQDENGSFDYDLSVLLKKIWDEHHPKLPLQIVNMELVMEDVNETTSAASDPGYEPDPNGEITPGLLAAIIVACIGTVSLLLLFGLMVYVRRRQKRFNYGQRCTPVSLDAYSVDSISVYDSVRSRRKGVTRTSKRSYGNLAFDDPNSPSHPMNFAGLANFSSDMDALQEEFEAVPQITVTTDDLPAGADVKNRYSNVIPLPETRVPLTPIEGEPLSDYINANYVRGPNNEEKFYIACQAPLQSTITDFWRMVWEQQTKVILMVCNLVEDGSEKCADYLPPSEVLDCHRLFGDFQITLKKREEKERYVISTLQIKNLEANLWREVIHIWFASWPDKGVPEEPSPLIAFLIESRSHMRNASGPHVVHCSPGTGRTGTVIACDILIREFERTRTVDVPRCVYSLRRDRAGAVKTKEQYVFIYKVLNHYAAMLTGGALDSI